MTDLMNIAMCFTRDSVRTQTRWGRATEVNDRFVLERVQTLANDLPITLSGDDAVVVFPDRYSGTYVNETGEREGSSKWLAMRGDFADLAYFGGDGGDMAAADFWMSPAAARVGSGATPRDALYDLARRIAPTD